MTKIFSRSTASVLGAVSGLRQPVWPQAVARHKLRPGLLRAAWLLALSLPAAAQGLRPTTQLTTPKLPTVAATTAATAPRTADFIVAVVNSEPITNSEVRAKLLRMEKQLSQQGAALPPREALTRQVLESLIVEKTQLQLALDLGLKVDDEALDQAELNVARQNQLSLDELHRRVQQDGLSVAQFREDLRKQVLVARLREREVESRVRVSELDVDQFLREQRDGTAPMQQDLNLAQVLVAVPETASAEQITALQARAQQAAQRARAGEDFAALVREFSDAPDRASTLGVMGLRSSDRYPTLFVEATQNLRVGGVAGPVRSGAGFHVLKVLDKQEAGLSVVQTHARHILLRPSAQLSESAAIARLADLRQRLVAGTADFAALAREYSQDGSAADGGDLGWANPGQFVPEFEEALGRLASGDISPPLVSRFGVHLIQLQERRTTRLSAREQRELARNVVREKKMDEAMVTWAQELRARAYVEFREPPQ
jgi:peptidyl-prolyl cis-trans isomerase SurA